MKRLDDAAEGGAAEKMTENSASGPPLRKGVWKAESVPLGILWGRLIWSAFADQVGALAVSVVPWAILASVTFGAIVVANLAALAPAAAAARTKTAAVLRSE